MQGSMIYDARPPLGFSDEEHYTGVLTPENLARCADCLEKRTHFHRGFESYALELADLCRGFRSLRLHTTTWAFFLKWAPGAHESGQRRRWRGHPVLVDDDRKPWTGELHREGGGVLGAFEIVNPPE